MRGGEESTQALIKSKRREQDNIACSRHALMDSLLTGAQQPLPTLEGGVGEVLGLLT